MSGGVGCAFGRNKRCFLFIDIILMNPVVQSCKAIRPPVYPKYEKASTVRLDLPRNTPISHANKIQREEINSLGGPQSTPSSTYPPPLLPTASPSPSEVGSLARQQQRRQEYHQFSRKNYFKTRRNIEQTQLQSRLTEKILPPSRSPSRDDQKRLKSKSALSYAKYFIKHVSIIPTEPSSNPPALPNEDTPQCPEEQPKRNNETSLQKKSNSIFSHQDRQKSRKKISERLKSIKNTRSKGGKTPCSIEKGGKQAREERRTPVKPAKIAGNICSIQSSQSNVLRMKARARNKRIILKVKQYHSRVPQEDLCLMVSSKIDRSFSDRREIVQRVELHLELLNLLPAYVKEFKEIYQEAECWEELVFLAYKKFYIERLKVQLALGDEQRTNEDLSCSNPFRFNFCSITDKDLDVFRNSLQCLRLQQKLASQNASIKQALRNLYNHIIEKSGKHVNLYQVDSFSQEIYYLMNEELKLLTENEIDSLQAVRERRIGFIIKCCLLVAFLNGESVEVDSVLAQNGCTQRMKDTYHAFIQYYTA